MKLEIERYKEELKILKNVSVFSIYLPSIVKDIKLCDKTEPIYIQYIYIEDVYYSCVRWAIR